MGYVLQQTQQLFNDQYVADELYRPFTIHFKARTPQNFPQSRNFMNKFSTC